LNSLKDAPLVVTADGGTSAAYSNLTIGEVLEEDDEPLIDLKPSPEGSPRKIEPLFLTGKNESSANILLDTGIQYFSCGFYKMPFEPFY